MKIFFHRPFSTWLIANRFSTAAPSFFIIYIYMYSIFYLLIGILIYFVSFDIWIWMFLCSKKSFHAGLVTYHDGSSRFIYFQYIFLFILYLLISRFGCSFAYKLPFPQAWWRTVMEVTGLFMFCIHMYYIFYLFIRILIYFASFDTPFCLEKSFP